MVEDNPPNLPSCRHARLMRQAQSPDLHISVRAQQQLLKTSDRIFRGFAKGKSGTDAEEAAQSARVAFVSNISKFDLDTGFQYTTYVRKMMVREVANNERVNYGNPSPQKVKRWEEAQDTQDGDLQIPVWGSVGEPDEFGVPVALEDSIPDIKAIGAFAVSDLQIDFQSFVTSLSQREQDVYRLLYVEQKTQAMAAETLKVTQARIAQIHAKILRQGKSQLAHLVAAA